jgi:hypothetical protein
VEFEMELSKLKVGQTVTHANGFTGIIEEIKEKAHYTDVEIRVTDQGNSFNEVGSVWTAMPEYITSIVKEAPSKLRVEAELAFTGLEQLEELVAQATEALEILAEESVFTAEFGQGIKFEGTKSDYKVFIEGLAELTKTGNEFRF